MITDEQVATILDDLRLCSASGNAAPTFLLDKAADFISRLNDIKARAQAMADIAKDKKEKPLVVANYNWILWGPCGFEIVKSIGYRHYDCVLEKYHEGDHQSAIWG